MSVSVAKNIFNDSPICYTDVSNHGLEEIIKSKDELGTQHFAKAFAEFVKDCDTPMTIGIQGDWGIGKTSLLNMVSAYLNGAKNKPYGITWFNTWHYSLFGQEEYLGIAVIKGLLDQLKKQYGLEEENTFFNNVAQKVGNVLKNAKFSGFGLNISAQDANRSTGQPDSNIEYEDVSSVMLQFRENFQQLVNYIREKEKYDKLVFFIDDIDRVKPIKALEMLESIKNFLDVENCVFFLAVDYEIVQIGMAEKLGQDIQKISGKSFFDKIIQLPFTMPSSSYDLGNYIRTLLGNSDFKVNETDKGFYEEVTSCTVGRNPRSIKRVINYAKLIRLIRGKYSTRETTDKDQGRKILYALLCMQVAWPEIFNHFVKAPTPATIQNIEDWEYQQKIPFIEKLYERTPNVDQLKSDISAYFDLLYDLLDKDNNGNIDQKELKPVHDILKVAKLSIFSDYTEATDVFFKILHENDTQKKLITVRDAFKKSKWITSGKFEYRMSGKRYATIIYQRKQIGSIVTLKTKPFIFRLNADEIMIEEYLKPYFEELLDIENLLRSIESESLSGFGDCKIDLSILAKADESIIKNFFNRLYDFVLSVSK